MDERFNGAICQRGPPPMHTAKEEEKKGDDDFHAKIVTEKIKLA
jgi:hypothetical protein